MKIPVTELYGLALHYAVGLANGWITYPTDSIEHGLVFHMEPSIAPFGRTVHVMSYSPSTQSHEAWRILQESKIALSCVPSGDSDHAQGLWKAEKGLYCLAHEDPIIALLRCHAALKFGPVVAVPDYLLGREGAVERGLATKAIPF